MNFIIINIIIDMIYIIIVIYMI